jgi:hypothetical protein
MILVKNINQYEPCYVYFTNVMKNNVMKNGNFIKILYLTPFFKMNGIYLKINIVNYLNENNIYRNNYIYNPYMYIDLIEKIKNIEIDILSRAGIIEKNPECDLYKKLISGNIKIITDIIEEKYDNFIIKISGIWENDNHYGLNYKFMRGNKNDEISIKKETFYLINDNDK